VFTRCCGSILHTCETFSMNVPSHVDCHVFNIVVYFSKVKNVKLIRIFSILLTVHLGTILVSNQLDTIFQCTYVLTTCNFIYQTNLMKNILIILVRNQLDAIFQCIYLFEFSTFFEQPSAHNQENQLYQYITWYVSLRVGGRLLCLSERPLGPAYQTE
jgi:hypothetical protein